MANVIFQDELHTAYDDGTEEVRFTDAELDMMAADPAFGYVRTCGHPVERSMQNNPFGPGDCPICEGEMAAYDYGQDPEWVAAHPDVAAPDPHRQESPGGSAMTQATATVSIIRTDLPANPSLGYPEPGSVWWTSLDGETFYPAGTDTSTAPLADLQEFWSRARGQGAPDADGKTWGYIGAYRSYIHQSARESGWPLTELEWRGR